ncbi:MAG: hypothetical protein AAF617_06905 [Bacteroidota bacterium]
MDFKDLLKEIKGNLLNLMGSKFEDLKDESKKDVQDFLNASKAKLERWTTLLAEGNITLDDYKWLVESQKDLVVLQGLYAAGVSKIKLGHLKNSILDTVIQTAIGFVKPATDDDNGETA